MRARTYGFLALSALGLAGVAAYSLSRGQERGDGGAPAARPVPSEPVAAGEVRPLLPAGDASPDLSKLGADQQKQYAELRQAAQRGAEWLARMNRVDGRFAYGQLPALAVALEGDNYLRQLSAALGLARAARLLNDERQAARATQAVVRFLDDTVCDPRDATVRYVGLPSVLVSRLSAAGLLVLAVHELPAPQPDLVEKSEQLCNFIRRQQKDDGSLSVSDATDGTQGVAAESVDPGPALCALMRSQQQRPAAWKTDVVRRALAYYHPRWRAARDPTVVPWQTAAYVEAYLATGEPAFADAVAEMNDWLCTLQFQRFDPQHAEWHGGFMSYVDGKAIPSVPQISSACYAESLVEACRLARQKGDVQRYDRYRSAVALTLGFLWRLQYTEANTQHFAPWYRRDYLLGGFHASHEDGNLRIDYTQQAVCALVQYLRYLAVA